MRLGQIARKLGVTQAEIVRYLSSQDMRIEEGSNVKLMEAHVRALYARFAPAENFDSREDLEVPEVASKERDVPSPEVRVSSGGEQNANLAAPPANEAKVLFEMPYDESATGNKALESHSAGAPDTIRVPKIELAGLKVVGKIDLPEPKKKESPPTASDDERQTTEMIPEEPGKIKNDGSQPASHLNPERRERSGNRNDNRSLGDRKQSRNHQTRERRSYKNPIAAQREQELEAEREKRKQKAAEDKERRTQNYQKRVKHSPPTKAARIIEEQVEVMDAETLNDRPTSWFGKFMKWLRS